MSNKKHFPTPIAKAVAASLGAAAAPSAVPAAQNPTPALSQEQLAEQTARAIAKIDQLHQYLTSGELHGKIAMEVIQLMGSNGTLETAVEAALNAQLPLITQELRVALGEPMAVPAAAEPAHADEAVAEAAPVKRTAEEVMAQSAFELVGKDRPIDTDTMLVFQVKLPSSMNPADSVVEFFSFDEHEHLQHVVMADGYAQLALRLFQSDPGKFFFGTEYLVQLMDVHAPAVVEDEAANAPAPNAAPPAPQIC